MMKPPDPGKARAVRKEKNMAMISFAFAAFIAACWAWDSRSLHRRLADLEAEIKGSGRGTG
jgi:hypothetical protein